MLFLASQSPRRSELLAQLGVAFSPLDILVPERVLPGEPAIDYVRRVAREKAGAGLLQVAAIRSAVVLAADTEVVLDEEVFGKPRDAADATQMLRRLAGRTHQVISVVCCANAGREESLSCVSLVRFAELEATAMAAYVDTGEWQGKAGGYAIQGRAAAFIEHLAGSYSAVMGLPLFETATLLRGFGITASI